MPRGRPKGSKNKPKNRVIAKLNFDGPVVTVVRKKNASGVDFGKKYAYALNDPRVSNEVKKELRRIIATQR